MVTISCLKSLIAWTWTWCINTWIEESGMQVAYMTVAGLNVAVYMTTIIMYMKGKQIRIWIHNTDVLQRLGLS
jgi:hypothetical protein